MFRQLAVRLRARLRRGTMEAELDEELRYHLENEIARNVQCGMSIEEARFAARRAFGSSASHKDAVRDSWGWHWLEQLGQDVRYAVRGIRRAPTFALTVVLTIALGLGLNGTAFTIFDAYVLRPLAVRDPSALYEITWVTRAGRAHAFSWSQYQELRRENAAFSELFAYRFTFARIDSVPAFGQFVTGNFFSMLGVSAALGRTLVSDDATASGGAAVVVLSHRAWENMYGADSAIVGRTIRIRGYPLQVVGIARAGFDGLGDVPLDFWIPITAIDQVDDGPALFGPTHPEALRIVVRVRPEASVAQAKAELMTRALAMSEGLPAAEQPLGPRLESRATSVPLDDQVLVILAPILVAFGLVLLIACANVANMMLARGLARQREIGIRLSLGAGRARLVRQLLTESIILAVPAAAFGYALSRVTIELGLRLMFATMPAEFAPYIRIVPLLPDPRVFAFMLATALAAALFFGLAPALQATRTSVVQATRGDFDTELRPSRLRNALVVGQVTVCVVLLVCAGILLRGARRLEHTDVGIRTHDIVQIDVTERARSRVLARLRTLPGIIDVAAASSAPLDGRYPPVAVRSRASERATRAGYDFVSSSFFRVLDIPILRGRNFSDEEERSEAPVAIVSDATARVLWPGRDPLGETLQLAVDTLAGRHSPLSSLRTVVVIGIAGNAVSGTMVTGLDEPVLYFPTGRDAAGRQLLARVAGTAAVARRAIDADLARVDPGAVEQIQTLDLYRAAQIYPFVATHWVSSALGVIALLLTLTGIYGVLSYVVAQRRKELGIRMALGATAGTIVGLVMRQALRLAMLGLGLGGALAVAVSSIFAANDFMLVVFDPVAYVGAGAMVLGACFAATYLPSRRAASVHPMEALRSD